MARYKKDQREQYQWLEGSLDTLLPEVSLVRDIAAGLERLDFSAFEKRYNNEQAGSSAINPRSLVGVIMLGLLRGITSSVQMARRCRTDIEFMWIAGGVHIEKSTLCSFRKHYRDELVDLSSQVLDALGQHDLLAGENMGLDGTIVRAASSRHAPKKRKHLEKKNEQLQKVLREKLNEDESDTDEALKALKNRCKCLQQALDEMTERGLDKEDDKMTLTEPDAGNKRQKDGAFAPGFNAQVVSDLDSGVIIHADIVDAGNDCGQLQSQVEQAQAVLDEVLGDACESGIGSMTADGAYHDIGQLDELEGEGIECFVSEARKANRKAPGVEPGYHAHDFTYDEATDTMQCPEGNLCGGERGMRRIRPPYTKPPPKAVLHAQPKGNVAQRRKADVV